MKVRVKVKETRRVYYTEVTGTQNENKVTELEIEIPEKYKNFNKKIVFITDDGVVWDLIQDDNTYKLTKSITKYRSVKFYIWLTKDDEDFRSEEKKLIFNFNRDANSEVTEEELNGINKVLKILEEKEAIRQTNEESRIEEEIIRQSNEKERQTAESTRKAEEINRDKAEKERASEEVSREKAENSRVVEEQKRNDEEKIRKSSEEERKANEELRKSDENDRKKAETTREDNEIVRESSETKRNTAEELRQSNEEIRIANENNRKTKEESRESAETVRKENESARQTNEDRRESTEEDRNLAEAERDTAEKERIFNENIRKSDEEERKINEEARKSAEIAREKNILELKEENKSLRNDLNNLIPSVKGEGENITLNNTAEARLKNIEIGGNSWQETRKGNLFNVNDRSTFSDGVTVDEEDWITFSYDNTNGERGAYRYAYTNVSKALKPSTEYLVVTEIKDVSYDTADSAPSLEVYKGGNPACQLTNSYAQKYSSFERNKKYIQKVTTKDSFEGCTSMLITQGVYNVGTKGSITFRISVLEDTSITENNFKYEPYGAMPSPEFISPIRNVEGNVDVEVCNNLLKPNWAQDLLDRLKIPSTDQNSRIVEIDSHRYFRFPAGLGFNTGLNYFAKDCFKPNTQYTFKCMMIRSTDNLATNVTFRYVDDTFSRSDLSQFANMTPVEYKFTSQANKTVKTIEVGYQSGATYIDLDNVMLYEGTTDRPFTEQKNKKADFPLQEGQVLHLGDYLASDGIHQKMYMYAFTGDEIFYPDSGDIGDTYHHRLLFSGNPNIPKGDGSSREAREKALCNMLKNAMTNNNTGELGYFYYDSAWIVFQDKKSVYSSSDEFKAKLKELYEAGTPLIIEYPLAEEIIIPYTPEQQQAYDEIMELTSYEGTTYVFSENEIKPIIKAEALIDVKTEHNKLQAQIDEIKELLSTSSTSSMLIDNLEKDLLKEV